MGLMEIITLLAATVQCGVRATVIVAIRERIFELKPLVEERASFSLLNGSSSFAEALHKWMECLEP